MNKQYDILKNEIEDFRKLGHKFLEKNISVGDFKSKSGGMGVYAQRGGQSFMIRLRTNSGLLPLEHLKLINSFIDSYDIKNIHLTTRQAVQLHSLGIDDVCDIMSVALDNGLYTRGGGGNFPRNVALSPMTGVEKNEAFDATEVANAISKYLIDQITEYKLPRKLKISVSSSSKDTANSTINDFGFLGKVDENGVPYFDLYIAGGLGNNPELSIKYPNKVNLNEVLYYIEAMVNLFMAEGDYTNRAKARTRYIPKRMGVEAFLQCFETHLQKVKNNKNLTLNLNIIPSKTQTSYSHKLQETPYLIPQRQDGLYTVIVHPTCGILKSSDYKLLVDFISQNNNCEARLSMDENIYIRNLDEQQAINLIQLTDSFNAHNKIQQSLSCIGVPTCQIGIEESQMLVKNILNHLLEANINEQYLPLIHVSGCQNSCARHQVAELGFVGGKRKVGDTLESVFTVFVGGKVKEYESKIGSPVGAIIARNIPSFIEELANILNNKQLQFVYFYKTNPEEFNNLVKKYAI